MTASSTIRQATTRNFDPATRSGTVLLDDGTEVAYDAAAFDAGGLRLLRIGQRVQMSVNGEGRVTALTLVTLPLP
jgi:2-phospho-L-lactate/phosphoenolpyruvate guanylyltransferase